MDDIDANDFFFKVFCVKQLEKLYPATSTLNAGGPLQRYLLKLGTIKNWKPFFWQKWVTSYTDISFATIDKHWWITKKLQQMLDGEMLPGKLNKKTNF